MAKAELKEPGKYDKWAVEQAVRTLKEAEQIKQDAKMMALVKKQAKKELKAISSVADLRAASEAMNSESDD